MSFTFKLYALRFEFCVKLMNLKNKRVLITAGPTWVPVDDVRVISNIATGETGILLSRELEKRGARVTLLLGPSCNAGLRKSVNIKKFRFFDELKKIILAELKSNRYDIVIHSAAVSDYRPGRIISGKIKSGLKILSLRLIPTIKIIDLLRKAAPGSLLVGFKLEPNADKKDSIRKARSLIRRAGLDLVVANSFSRGKYAAYIVGRSGFYGPFLDKKRMALRLADIAGGSLRKN